MQGISERLRKEEETYNKIMDKIGFNLRVCCPGIIQSFDSARQTVTVKPAVRERLNFNGDLQWKEIPLLVDVPIVIPRAGGYSLTLPIQTGDECLVVFADSCIDAWYQSGGVQNQIDRRRHDLSDGFAIIGAWSQPNVIDNYSTDTVQMRNDDGTAYVEIDQTTINVVTTGTVNINASTEVNITTPKATVTAAITEIIASSSCSITTPLLALGGLYSSMRRLIDERFKTLFDSHIHSGVQTGSGNTGVPTVSLTLDDNATSQARAI